MLRAKQATRIRFTHAPCQVKCPQYKDDYVHVFCMCAIGKGYDRWPDRTRASTTQVPTPEIDECACLIHPPRPRLRGWPTCSYIELDDLEPVPPEVDEAIAVPLTPIGLGSCPPRLPQALMRPKLLLIMLVVQTSARPAPQADALVHVTVPPSSWPWPWSCYHGHLHVSLVPPGP